MTSSQPCPNDCTNPHDDPDWWPHPLTTTRLDDITHHPDTDRILELTPTPHGILITERCDEYFTAHLNRDQVQRIIDWLTTHTETMQPHA